MNLEIKPGNKSSGAGEILLPPSNLDRVVAVLERNTKRLFVAGTLSHFSPTLDYYQGEPLTQIAGNTSNHPVHISETFFVAPRKDGFNTKQLEKLRREIGKTLAPVALDVALEDRSFNQLSYGYIAWDDPLATESKTITQTTKEIEPGILEKLRLKAGESRHASFHTIHRRVFVKFVPHPILAIILRNEVPRAFGHDEQSAKDLDYAVSEAQLRRLKELLQEQFPSAKHIFHELIVTAHREKYALLQEEIDRFNRVYGS